MGVQIDREDVGHSRLSLERRELRGDNNATILQIQLAQVLFRGAVTIEAGRVNFIVPIFLQDVEGLGAVV